MTIQLWPTGKSCNLNCKYCYNLPRKADPPDNLNLEKIKSRVEELAAGHEAPVVLSGGEPLLTDKALLEELLSYSFNKFGQSQLQTNGTLIDRDHIDLFKRYNTSVGVSIDGPGELNDLRRSESTESTRNMTKRTIENIDKLRTRSISVGISLVIHEQNAGSESLQNQLINFLRDLAEKGVQDVLFHSGIFFNYFSSDSGGPSKGPGNLPLRRLEEFYLRLAKIQLRNQKELSWKPFKDLWHLLQGKTENVKCTWNPCDPWNTKALRSITPEGTVLTCPAVGPDGINPPVSKKALFHRQLILQQTPQDKGGCKNCRFYVICLGHCPAAGQNNDPRNKSVYCKVFKSIFKLYEKKLTESGQTPLSQKPEREGIRKQMLNHYKNGRRVKLHEVMSSPGH